MKSELQDSDEAALVQRALRWYRDAASMRRMS